MPSWFAHLGRAFGRAPAGGHAGPAGPSAHPPGGASPLGYTCHSCGTHHAELPLGYGAPAPDYWHAIPEGERRKRAQLSDETCVLDGEHFFIKGNVEIPIHGQDTPFTWTVWTSLSQPNYERALRLWHDRARVNEPPYFGWLTTRLPPYPDTLSLQTHVHTRAVGLRPLVELEATEHPLAVEQRMGITMARVQEITELCLHGRG
jgi:hypothetical protein